MYVFIFLPLTVFLASFRHLQESPLHLHVNLVPVLPKDFLRHVLWKLGNFSPLNLPSLPMKLVPSGWFHLKLKNLLNENFKNQLGPSFKKVTEFSGIIDVNKTKYSVIFPNLRYLEIIVESCFINYII